MRLTKTLLAAAAFVGASTATSKAYDLYESGWDYSQPGFSFGYSIGDDYWTTEWRTLNADRTLNAPFYQANASERDLVNAGVYRGITGSFSWNGNEYNNGFGGAGGAAYVNGELRTDSDGEGAGYNGFDFQDGFFGSGTFNFDSRDTTTNLAIGQVHYGIGYDTDGTYFGSNVSGEATVFEREIQVARTGSGFDGANALSAFASDNSETLSGSFYNASIVGRNVLRVASAFYDGEGSYGPDLAGSVIRPADIALGFSGSEGLFAKDGGWLDIRGDLTLGASGTIYIRDGEITSNIYTQFYTPGTLDTVGRLAIETGILSVREHFAQDMAATWGQTLGFRDGAVNSTRLILEGVGYGNFDGEGEFLPYGPEGSSFGALRSITGENVQDGNISVVADGEGFFGPSNGAIIGTDAGSKLTINGTVNGLNSEDSEGGAILGYFSQGQTIQNGRILSGVDDVLKAGSGELLLTASNLFTGDVQIQEGTLRITNSGALSGTSGQTYVRDGASLVLDVVSPATGLSLVDDIHILGNGKDGVGGAIHNKAGANTTSGSIWVITPDGLLDPELPQISGKVTVAAGTSLSVQNLRASESENNNFFRVDVSGSGDTAGSFVVRGNTGEIDNFYKDGAGNATLTALAADLDDIDVNDGKLLVLGSVDSAADKIYDKLDIDGVLDADGKPLGEIEIRGTHHYGEFNIDGVDALITGSVTHHYDYDGFDIDITRNSTVTVDAGAFLISRGDSDSADIEDDATLIIKGTFNAFDDSFIDLDDTGTLDIRAGGVVNSRVVADDDSNVIIASADGEGLGAGVLNGNILAYDSANITLNGVINGDVTTYGSASLTLGANAVHNGDYTAYGSATIVINGSVNDTGLGHDFSVSGNALLKGSGSIGGDLTQTGGTVAPGNSIDILTVLGDYTINAGSLLIEIGGNNGAGIDPDGHDQLRVGGSVVIGDAPSVVGGEIVAGANDSFLVFSPYNAPFFPRRGDSYQVLANGTGGQIATVRKFDSVVSSGIIDVNRPLDANGDPTELRVIFDHSTGIAYGTGLAGVSPVVGSAAAETFRDYGSNDNRREIGRAVWMEAISHENSDLRRQDSEGNFLDEDGFIVLNPNDAQVVNDQNFAAQAINAHEGQIAGRKAFILTRNEVDPSIDEDTGDLIEGDETQVQTDLGAAAVSVLAASDVGSALDALSPEAYVGITELGVRVTRNFAQLPASKRKLAAANEWDFSVGYAGEQITADSGATGFTNYKVSSDQINLTAARDLSKNLRLTLAAGLDDGKVGAAGFTADTDTQAFGLGLGFTPDTKGWTADLGIALTRTDWNATRGVSQTGSDNEDGLGVALRVSLAPTVDGALSYAPYLGLSYATQDQSAVAEGGADNDGMVGVGFAGYERKSLVSELGLKAEYALKPGTTLTGVVAWEHEFEDSGETTLDAEFTEDGVTDTRFAVTSKGFGSDIFRVGVGVRVELGAKSAFSLGYDALLSSDSKSGQGIKADVSFRF